jgi:Fe-S-cluster containining protein
MGWKSRAQREIEVKALARRAAAGDGRRGEPGRGADSRGRTDELLGELAEVFRDVDAAFGGWSCAASTECCRFGITGREPYVTSVELLAIRRAVAALGGARAFKRATSSPAGAGSGPRSLPMAPARDERPCPLLTSEGRCAVYASRPLGCRTFYCDAADKGAPVRHKEITGLVRRVQGIAVRHEPGGDQGRPLTRALTGLG